MAEFSVYDNVGYGRLNLPSFQELMVAPAYLTEQHDLANERLSETLSQANLAEVAAMQDPNSRAAQMYQAYTSSLNQAIEDLSSKGLQGSGIKSRLGKLRADYNSQISPILGAYEQQKADKARYDELVTRDPSWIGAYDPSRATIDSYLSTGNQSYVPQGISGQALTTQVANAAKPFADWVNQNLPQLAGTGLPFQYFTMIQKGFSPNDVAMAIARDTGVSAQEASQGAQILAQLRDNVLVANGVYNLFDVDSEEFNRAVEYANQGLYQAIGTRQFGNMTDTFNQNIAVERFKASLKSGDTGIGSVGMYPIVNVDANKGKEIDKKLSSVERISNILTGIPANADKNRVLDSLRGEVTQLQAQLLPVGSIQTGGQYATIVNTPIEQNIADLTNAIDLIESGGLDKYSGNNYYEKATNGLLNERAQSAIRSNAFSPRLMAGTNLSRTLQEALSTGSNYENLVRLDDDYSKRSGLFKGSNVKKGDLGDLLYDNNGVIQFIPSTGLVVVNSSGDKTQVPASLFGRAFEERYNELNDYLNELLANGSANALMEATKTARTIAYLLDLDTNSLNKIQSRTTSKD